MHPLALKTSFAVIVCMEFLVLALLGLIWLRLLYWTDLLRQSRPSWLYKIRCFATFIRGVRIQAEAFDYTIPSTPLILTIRQKIRLFQWVSRIYRLIQNGKKRRIQLSH